MAVVTEFINTLFSQIQGTDKSLLAYLGLDISCIIQYGIHSLTPQIIKSKTNLSLNNLQTIFFIYNVLTRQQCHQKL